MPEEKKTEDPSQQNTELTTANAELTKRLETMEAKQNDPAYIDSLHRAHFGDQKPAEESKGDDDPEPKFDTLNTDNMTNDQVVVEMERRQNQKDSWRDRQVDKKFQSRDNDAAQREDQRNKEAEINKIRSFSESQADFGDHKERIREVYGVPMSIEDAYSFAKWEKLAKEAEASGGRRSSVKTSDSKEPDKMTKHFDNVRDGAKAALDEVLQGVDSSIL